ncbi:MAG TPA: hypothetical protein VHS78_18570 [Candidatus Elarobacter sp.]|jgi:hypothetical protein|nr:hypothetical protein [Candidatus Elarobacter sp.]
MKRTPRFVRLVWLAVLMLVDEPRLYRDYRPRFGVCTYDFRLDRKVVRRAALYVWAVVYLDYRLWFYLESSSID